MASSTQVIRLGTRGSALARWQTDTIASMLATAYPDSQVDVVVIKTRGDTILDQSLPSIGGKGVFTEELERALHEGDIDGAVHSLKDLPTESTEGLQIASVPVRADVHDVLVSRDGLTIDQLPEGAVIGTSSRRRAAQLLAYRPDLKTQDIRGNVETRIRKAKDSDGPYDATVLAYAGVDRLNLGEHITQKLPLEVMLNAPGQGAMAVQSRDDQASHTLFSPLLHVETWLAVTAERAFLNALGGGCSLPVGAHAELHDGALSVRGVVCSVDGSAKIDLNDTVSVDAAELAEATTRAQELGAGLARSANQEGAGRILADLS